MLTDHGAGVSMDWLHHQVHKGNLHYVNKKLTSVSISAGAMVYVTIPLGVALHYTGRYYSSSGGVLDAYVSPVLSALGTEITPRNYNGHVPAKALTKFYFTPTVTSDGTLFRSIGIAGGTAVAGNGATGEGESKIELIVGPGQYLLRVTPGADTSTVIYDIDFYEETE